MTKLVRPTPSTYRSRGWIEGVHRGEDFGNNYTEKSMEILASADGTVLSTYTGNGYNGGWGRRIRIDHGHGAITTYNHIRPGGVLVVPGQVVKAGQLIARMGSSGASTGTHLHHELYLNGVRVDPLPYYTKDLPGTGPVDPPKPQSSGNQTFSVPSGGQYYYWNYANALKGDYSPVQLLRANQTLAVVENPGTGPVRVRCADGDLVWVGTRKHPAKVNNGGSPATAPTKYWFDVPAGGQYYYNQYNNALNGNYDPSQIIRGGSREVVENPGTGPVRVKANDGTLIWVGTRRNPAKIRKG